MKKKTRGVFERPEGSGVYWISWFHEGKQLRRKIGSYAKAVKAAEDARSASRSGVVFRDKAPKKVEATATLGNLIDDVLVSVSNRGLKDEKNYGFKAGIVKAALGAKDAASVTPQDIDAWLAGHCRTPATANRYKAFFSLVYKVAIRNGKVKDNPAKAVDHRKEPVGRQRFLSKDEYARLYSVVAAEYPEHLPEFVVSVYTGMRQGEQYGVTWADVDLDRKIINLHDTKNGERRTVHLHSVAVKAIQSIERGRPSDLVFLEEKTRQWFTPCLDTAGIADYTWHNNRHTFCSWLAMAGASMKEIMESAGHKSIQMSARYAHLSPAHTASVIDRL